MQEADWKRMNDRVNAANKFNQVQNDPTLFQISEFIEHLRDQFAQHHIDRDPVDMLIRALRLNAFAGADDQPEFYYFGHDLIPVDAEYLKAALSVDLCDAETFFKYSFAKRSALARWCRHPAQNIELPMGWSCEEDHLPAPLEVQTSLLADNAKVETQTKGKRGPTFNMAAMQDAFFDECLKRGLPDDGAAPGWCIKADVEEWIRKFTKGRNEGPKQQGISETQSKRYAPDLIKNAKERLEEIELKEGRKY